MADEKITALANLAQGSVQSDDQLVVVDVHDATMAPSGTDKNLLLSALLTAALRLGLLTYNDGTNTYSVVVSSPDVIIENQVTGALGDLDVGAQSGLGYAFIDGQQTTGGLTAEAFARVEALPNSSDAVMHAVDGHAHTVSFQIFADNGHAPTTRALTIVAQWVVQGANAAPTNADLQNGAFALWLDQTIGATKLNIVAKDSGGTVRTGSIALT